MKKALNIPWKWKPPGAGDIYKVNTDAAKKSGNKVGFGNAMRDSVGDVMLTACEWIEGDVPIEIMEAVGARFAMQITLEAGLKDIVLETDNAKLFSHLQKGKVEHTDFGLIVGDILKLVASCDFISYSQVKRSGNQGAHYMAKTSFSYTPSVQKDLNTC